MLYLEYKYVKLCCLNSLKMSDGCMLDALKVVHFCRIG